jgi:hypothetical protein
MSRSDVFALKNSNLNAFLFADIGEEINGSRLTVLSALARLGKDPWAEAARWDREPKAHAIDALTASINDMPLRPEAIREAGSIAARLILLLPTQSRRSTEKAAPKPTQRVLAKWMWIAILLPWVSLAINAGMALSHRPHSVTSMPTFQPYR